jgi:hypothetical protein
LTPLITDSKITLVKLVFVKFDLEISLWKVTSSRVALVKFDPGISPLKVVSSIVASVKLKCAELTSKKTLVKED